MDLKSKLALVLGVGATAYAIIVVARRFLPTYDAVMVKYVDSYTLSAYNWVSTNIVVTLASIGTALGLVTKIKADATSQLNQVVDTAQQEKANIIQQKDTEKNQIVDTLTTQHQSAVDDLNKQLADLTTEKETLSQQLSAATSVSATNAEDNKALSTTVNGLQDQVISLQNQVNTLSLQKSSLEKSLLEATPVNLH